MTQRWIRDDDEHERHRDKAELILRWQVKVTVHEARAWAC
jgi:hypothetical protein